MDITAWLLTGMMAASGADLATTYAATNRGARETNPAFSTPQTLLAAKVAVGTGQLVVLQKLRAKHPRLVKVIAAGTMGAYAGMAAHNWRVAQRQGRR